MMPLIPNWRARWWLPNAEKEAILRAMLTLVRVPMPDDCWQVYKHKYSLSKLHIDFDMQVWIRRKGATNVKFNMGAGKMSMRKCTIVHQFISAN